MPVAIADPIGHVKAIVEAHEALVRAGDVDGILANAADDAVVLVAGAPLVCGKAPVRALYTQVLAMGAWDFRHEYTGAEVCGDIVALHGVARGTLTAPGTDPSPVANNFILTFRKQPDGQYRFWRVVFAPVGG